MGQGLCLLVLSNGAVGHTQRWVDYFVDRGDEVHLASLECGVPTRAVEHRLPTLAPIGALKYPLAVPAARRLADRVKPDVIIGHFVPNYGFMGALMGRRPLVSVVWGSDILLNPGRTPFHRWRAKHTLETADVVLSDADMLSDAILARGIQPARLETFTFGIDTDRFRPGDTAKPEPAILLSYRQLLPLYHVDLLIRAAPILASITDVPFEIRIIGEGSERPKLIALAAELGVSDRVTFVEGRLTDDELIAEIQRATLYISTSRSDTTSVSLLEAMASGACPVVTDIDGNREWITHGENGLLVPLEVPHRLAEAANELLQDPDRRARIVEQNLKLVRARGDWATNMERTRRLLIELTARGACD